MISMVPSLVLIFIVLGTILVGLATPTEGGAMGAAGALAWRSCIAASPGMFWQAMDTTLKLSTMVIFIVVGSTMFA